MGRTALTVSTLFALSILCGTALQSDSRHFEQPKVALEVTRPLLNVQTFEEFLRHDRNEQTAEDARAQRSSSSGDADNQSCGSVGRQFTQECDCGKKGKKPTQCIDCVN